MKKFSLVFEDIDLENKYFRSNINTLSFYHTGLTILTCIFCICVIIYG